MNGASIHYNVGLVILNADARAKRIKMMKMHDMATLGSWLDSGPSPEQSLPC